MTDSKTLTVEALLRGFEQVGLEVQWFPMQLIEAEKRKPVTCGSTSLESIVNAVNAALAAAPQAQEPATPKDWKEALLAAVSAIYFDDSSDYRSALFSVVRYLAPGMDAELDDNPRAAFEKAQKLVMG